MGIGMLQCKWIPKSKYKMYYCRKGNKSMKNKNKREIDIHSSTAEYLTFIASVGDSELQLL